MTKKLISWLSILTVFLALLWSCHNEDFAKGETEPQRNNANFFRHTQKGGINAKSGVDYVNILEAYNREKDFLSTMPDQQGMPIWDKMQIVDAENATGLMIPLSYDNKSMSSVLFAIVDDENTVTGVRDFDNRLLENITYSGNIDKAFREKMLYTFMYMDHKTFGNEDFTNIPTGLFDDLKYNKTYGRIKIKNFEEPQNAILGNTGKIMWTQMCSMVWSCSHHGEGTCDYCMQLCHKKVCGDFMVFIGSETDYPTPSSGGSEGGGGATPSPDGIPPKDACIQTGMPFYRLAPQCVGNGGGDIPILDPCSITKKMLNRPNVQAGITTVKAQALQTLSNINTGETGFKEKKDGTLAPADINSSHKVVYNDVTDGVGGYHNHTALGKHMFSPPDIADTLFGFAAAQNNVSDAYFGMIAAEWCNCPPSNKKFLHYIIQYTGAATDLGAGGNYNFTAAQMKQFEKDYQKKADKLSNTYINGNTYIQTSGELNEKGLEKLFFETLNNMGLAGKVTLQKVEDNGTVNNITLDINNMPVGTPCPN